MPTFAWAWTPTVRTDVRAIEDSNIYLQDAAPLVAGQTVRGVPVRAADEEFVAGLTLGLSQKATPTGTPAVDLTYSGEVHRFSDHTGESHVDHRFLGALLWTQGETTLDAKASVLEVVGSRTPPVYNEVGGLPGMAGDPVRSRRAQTVVNTSGAVTERLNAEWRARLTGSLINQDFHTTLSTSLVGCANYVDRGQGLLGAELGRAFTPTLTGWLAVRIGKQWENDLPGYPENFSNTIERALAGVEGKLAPTLKVSLWAGPSLHRFTTERRAGTRESLTMFYTDSAVTWTPSAKDTLTASVRHQLWPGTSGRAVYRELKADVAWSRKWTKSLDGGVRGGVLHGNFGGLSTSNRNDNVFTTAAFASQNLGAGFKVDVSLTREWAQSCIMNTPGRAYSRWLTCVGLSRVW